MTFQYYPPQLLQKARETYWGELAWHVCDIPDVLEYAHSENLVILGGDVITPQEKHTYDNWYYNISHSLTIEKNVQASIDLTRSYIGAYVRKNGNNYLFVVSLTRLLFVNEQIACTEPPLSASAASQQKNEPAFLFLKSLYVLLQNSSEKFFKFF